MLYEIINPSDAYTIEAPDLEIATVACVALGNGQYAFTPITNDPDERKLEVPLFLFGDHDEFCKQHFDTDLDGVVSRVLDTRRTELADCLDSALIGSAADRREFDMMTAGDTPEQRTAKRDARHEQRRSSLNDIGGRAYAIATNLRIPAPTPADA
jgi:hypothetical protein